MRALAAAAVFAASAMAAERPNVLFIAVDDLRNEIGALGVNHAKTPALDAFASTARVFTNHYVQVPTCGASRCALLRGRYPDKPVFLGNDAVKATQSAWGADSLPSMFRRDGYRTLALAKISHYPGGRTGKDWAEGPSELPGAWDREWVPESPWKTPKAMMHGYANGAPRIPGKSPAWEAHDGPDTAYPDAWVAADAVKTLGELAKSDQPWFFAVGFFKPHLPFAAPSKWFDLHAAGIPGPPPEAAAKPDWPSSWHASGELLGTYAKPGGRKSVDGAHAAKLRQAYAASTSYMDAQMGRVLDALRETGQDRRTIVVVWGDHGFLLGEHGMWGKHNLFEEALRSPLMIRVPGQSSPGTKTRAVVETVDLLPTLADLCSIKFDGKTDGRSLRPQVADPSAASSKPAASFWGDRRTIRDDRWRLTARGASSEEVELYDYETDPLETRNHAAGHPEVVVRLKQQLARLPRPAAR